ncbi:MAG: hypothetical protein M3512_18790 [Bacteroidota bacterium]|nr:hypothetical protein [Bacteroidota bacterium]MDQ3535722.1 hypothetical protein [Bacteroidota bacterium]
MDIKKDLHFLIGKTLMQISFGLYQVQLHFSEDLLIEVGHGIDFFELNGASQKWRYSTGREYFSLNILLETTVIKANVDLSNNLIINFENEKTLKILKGKDGHESFIIYNKGDFQVL